MCVYKNQQIHTYTNTNTNTTYFCKIMLLYNIWKYVEPTLEV